MRKKSPIKSVKMFSFRVDQETLDALDLLMSESGRDKLRNRVSNVIREAILEKAERLKNG